MECRLSGFIFFTYMIFSSAALVWGLIQISKDRKTLQTLTSFYTGLVMFILGTWKGMMVSSLQHHLTSCHTPEQAIEDPGSPRCSLQRMAANLRPSAECQHASDAP